MLPALLCSLLFSCAKVKWQEGDTTILTKPVKNLSEAQNIATSAQVSCGEIGGCNPSVGMLTMASSTEVGACSASMISSDIAITNSHCIPEDLKASGSSCQGRIWLTFVNSPGLDKRLECSQVLEATDINEGGLVEDMAFIRFTTKSNRPALPISHQGFRDGETVALHKVNPFFSDRSAKGILGVEHCKTIHGTDFTKSNDPRYRMMIFGDCTVIHGNSGGPLIAGDGSLRGVIQALLKMDLVQDSVNEAGYDSVEPLSQLNMGSNLACHAIPELEGARPADCNDLPRKVDFRVERAELVSRPNIERLFQRNLDPSLRGFRWKISQNEKNITGAPECLYRNAQIDSDIIHSYPSFQLLNGYDRYFRRKMNVANANRNARLFMNKIGLEEFQVEFRSSTATDNSSIFFEGSLGYCN